MCQIKSVQLKGALFWATPFSDNVYFSCPSPTSKQNNKTKQKNHHNVKQLS